MRQAIVVFVLLFVSSSYSLTCTFNFTKDMIGRTANITTDLAFSISLRPPSSSLCAGANLSLQMPVSHSWYNSIYDTGLMTNGQLETCFFNYPQSSKNNPIHWISSEKFQLFSSTSGINTFNNKSNTIQNFTNFINQNNITYFPTDIASTYLGPLSNSYFHNKKAAIAIYCKGKIRLFSTSTNFNYSQESEYISAPFSSTQIGILFSPKDLPNNLSAVKLKATLTVEQCVALSRDYINNTNCPNSPDSVWVYTPCNINRVFESNEITVPIDTKFSCSALPITASISNSSPGAGSEVNLSINITNNLTKEIQIMNITLSNSTLGSGFSLISPFLPLPAVISPSASQQFYARLRVPPSNGQKEIKLNITYMPTSADCTGSRPTCNLSEIHALSINVGPSAGPDYAIVSLRFEPQQVPLFGRTRLTIEVKNIGNQNAANNTTTWVNGCELQTLPLKPLAAGETANQTVLCRCRQIGMQNVYVEVNKERTQYETNYTNNIRDAQYLCNIIQPQCSDFV